jgi:tripartite-type tricarboxylate transporter receptor subunit TctC
MKYRLTSVLLAFATFGITALPMVTHAQNYPNRSISVVVPFPAGGPSDVVPSIWVGHLVNKWSSKMSPAPEAR